MTIDEMISRYNISLATEGRIRIGYGDIVRKDNMLDAVREAKAEIVAELTARKEAQQQRALAERNAKIDAIDGLKELRDAIEDNARRWQRHTKSIEIGEVLIGYDPIDTYAIRTAHPRAAAYLKAEAYSLSENFAKSQAGRKALDRIIDGDDCESAIEDMESEWSAYCTAHMWD